MGVSIQRRDNSSEESEKVFRKEVATLLGRGKGSELEEQRV